MVRFSPSLFLPNVGFVLDRVRKIESDRILSIRNEGGAFEFSEKKCILYKSIAVIGLDLLVASVARKRGICHAL